MQVDRSDVFVIPKRLPIIIVLSAIALLAIGIGYAVYQHNVAVHQAAIDTAQRRLDYLNGKSADLSHLQKDLTTQWAAFDNAVIDGARAGEKRHDGLMAGSLSEEDAKVLAKTELSDTEKMDTAITAIQREDTNLVGIYQSLYGADAVSAFARDSEKRNEDFAQMQTFWWRAAEDNVDNLTASINDDNASSSSSDIQGAYNQSDSYANMGRAIQPDVEREAVSLNKRLSADIKNAKAALAKVR